MVKAEVLALVGVHADAHRVDGSAGPRSVRAGTIDLLGVGRARCAQYVSGPGNRGVKVRHDFARGERSGASVRVNAPERKLPAVDLADCRSRRRVSESLEHLPDSPGGRPPVPLGAWERGSRTGTVPVLPTCVHKR